MKRILVLLTVLAIAANVDAKVRVGIKGGANFATFSKSKFYDFSHRTGWHAGVMMNVGLPFGLTIQPELLYSSKGVTRIPIPPTVRPLDYILGFGTPLTKLSVNYIEIPIDLQWGIKLPLVRPYLSLTPYASYMTNSSFAMKDVNKWDGGVGVGAGVDVWKFQLAIKYFWGFDKVSDLYLYDSFSFSPKNRNIMLSLGVFL